MVQEPVRAPRFERLSESGRPVPEQVADTVRTSTESGEYQAGSRLPNESELARQLKVARSSVRSALQRLETERFVEVRRGLGWYVRRSPPIGQPGIDLFAGKRYKASDLFEMRIALETLGVGLAALRADEGEIDEIDKRAREHAESSDDLDELLRTDQEFHLSIMQAGHNELLLPTYDQVVNELSEWRRRSFAEGGAALRSTREHNRIVRFVRNNDAAGARAAMNTHLERLYLSLPDLDEEPLDVW